MTPTISTTRLSLRPLTKVVSQNIAWLRDPKVVRFSEQRHRPHTISTQLRYVNSFVGKSHLWGIHRIEDGRHIGNISSRHDEPNDVADVGVMIGETKCWAQGYAGEAWARVCGWLLEKDNGNIRKIEAGCAKNNEAMLRIIKGSGFKQEGELLNHFLFEGNPVSAMLFGRMR